MDALSPLMSENTAAGLASVGSAVSELSPALAVVTVTGVYLLPRLWESTGVWQLHWETPNASSLVSFPGFFLHCVPGVG